jgi:predicted phosphoadenosine phosphosulfate sulfurtransferase
MKAVLKLEAIGLDSVEKTRMWVAIRRRRRVGVLFMDLEGQYELTIQHGLAMHDLYREHADWYWLCLPIHLRNAVSQFEPFWVCWDPERRADWIREPPEIADTSGARFPFYRQAMEFEEFVPEFGHWFGGEKLCACFVGIRSDESLNRWRTIASRKKITHEGHQWTTWLGRALYNIYPIYDWRTEDIWRYHARNPGLPHNELYDRMYQAGLTIHQMRICQPYGDDQRKGLHLFHVIEPKTWGRVLARVNGANQGALYSQERGNILGVNKISLPDGHTWESFAGLILDTMPTRTAEHYRNKIAVFLRWYQDRGYQSSIPDFADPKDEASRKTPSWRRICKMLLRNDYWGKGLSFTQTESHAYQRYLKLMKVRRKAWL